MKTSARNQVFEQLKQTKSGVVVSPEGEMKLVKPKNGTDFKLAELSRFVKGHIEIVRTISDMIMVVNEEGLLDGLDVNPVASNLYSGPTPIVGHVLICPSELVK